MQKQSTFNDWKKSLITQKSVDSKLWTLSLQPHWVFHKRMVYIKTESNDWLTVSSVSDPYRVYLGSDIKHEETDLKYSQHLCVVVTMDDHCVVVPLIIMENVWIRRCWTNVLHGMSGPYEILDNSTHRHWGCQLYLVDKTMAEFSNECICCSYISRTW